MSKLGLRRKGEIQTAIGAYSKRLQHQSTEAYKDYVWHLFTAILENTPQYSGKAVANWVISTGSPDLTYDPTFGDEPKVAMVDGEVQVVPTRQKGDREWILKAIRRNSPRLPTIKSGTPVFISNVVADETGFAYLDDLEINWRQKLRAVNHPYRTAAELAAVIEDVHRVGSRMVRKGDGYVRGVRSYIRDFRG